jgi:hypothetical protein
VSIHAQYVIERDVPGAGKLTWDELHAISQKFCSVLRKLGPQVQWAESFVTLALQEVETGPAS